MAKREDITDHKKPTHPEQLIREFFTSYSLPESKEALWNWFKITITGSFHQLCSKNRQELTDFYEELEKLLTAVRAQDALNENAEIESQNTNKL